MLISSLARIGNFRLIIPMLLFVVTICGCGKEEIAADTTPFEAAITKYLAQQSMGMKVTEFLELTVEGATAEAFCKLQDADGLYGLGVTWKFVFNKEGNGWAVASHVQDAKR